MARKGLVEGRMVAVIMGIFGNRKPPLAVECGDCFKGAPAGLKSCPACGVPWEEDIAKCSHCASWIPDDAPRCPKCGTQFGTFRSQWAMKSHDRRIMLPRSMSAEELMAKVAAGPQGLPGHPAASPPGAVEGPRAVVCPKCGGWSFREENDGRVCEACGTRW